MEVEQAKTSEQAKPTSATEQPNRLRDFKIVRFMIVSATKLQMSDVALATATMILHKFMKSSPPNTAKNPIDPFLVAMTAIYMAGKIEEEELKIRNVINVCYRTFHHDKPPLELDDTFWALRHSIIQTELVIVRVLSFHLVFNHPHQYLLSYLDALYDWIPLRALNADLASDKPPPPVIDLCWLVLRDMLHTDLYLRYRPQEVAVAIIYLACSCYGVRIPHDDAAELPWYRALDKEASRSGIHDIISEIISVYEFEEGLDAPKDLVFK